MRALSRVGIAVIGAGYWGAKLVNEYLELSLKREDVRLRGIADKSLERLLCVGQRFSLPSSMLKKDYHEVLRDSRVDGVHIATPNETHYEIAAKAIAAGKNVLLEKPMCLTSSNAFKLARCAEKNNLVLLIGHIFRFSNAINKVKEMVETEEIGEIRCIELRWVTQMPPPPGRDIIFDLAPHPIDVLNHILEEWPERVYVEGRSYERKEDGLEEIAFALLEFPENMIASVTLSWIHYGPKERTVAITSERSRVLTEAVEQTIKAYENNRTRNIPVKRNNTIESEVSHFVNCVRKNDPPINSALTGIMNVRVLEALKRSLEENRVATIV